MISTSVEQGQAGHAGSIVEHAALPTPQRTRSGCAYPHASRPLQIPVAYMPTHLLFLCVAQSEPCVPGTPIKKNSKLRLLHASTRKWLHSHMFYSPLSNNQEVRERGLACAGPAGLARAVRPRRSCGDL